MRLTISGSITHGPSWIQLQKMVRTMRGEKVGRFVRIRRRDGGCDYRAVSGVYDLTYVPEVGDAVEIELHVNAEVL